MWTMCLTAAALSQKKERMPNSASMSQVPDGRPNGRTGLSEHTAFSGVSHAISGDDGLVSV